MKDKRLNIGLLIDDFDHNFSNNACRGAELAAKALDANLFIFPGHYIGKPDTRYSDKEFEYQYNTVFSLPSVNNVDIIYVVLGTIGSRADMQMQKEFIESFADVPVVCLFSNFEDFPSVTFDNRKGLESAIDHLIDEHGARNIGFVSGPVTNRDARDRLDVYSDTLKKHGIPVEKSRIVYGDFTENCSDKVDKLLDLNKDLDAIVFANDNMAIGGYQALKRRGLQIGKDILVTGFDDDVFAINLNPPLTTVEASSAELTYKAVMNAQNYINGSALSDMTVETRLVTRESCGCSSVDTEAMSAALRLDSLKSGDKVFKEEIKRFLFGVFADDDPVMEVKEKLSSFFDSYADYVLSDISGTTDLNDAFTEILQTPILTYTTPEKFYNILQTMQYEAEKLVKDNERSRVLTGLFADFYRRLSFSGISVMSVLRERSDRLQRMVNKQSGDAFLLSNNNEVPYELLLDGLYSMGFDKSILYLFQGSIRNKGFGEWVCPRSILLKAMSDKDGVHTLVEEQQLLRTERMFSNDFICGDERRTMVVSPLFVGADIYGFMVNELDTVNLMNIAPVAIKLSVMLKSLTLIESQNRAEQRLKISIDLIMRDNVKLNEMSKKDELTGLFNRRGFIANAEKTLNDPCNSGKVGILCISDMDNLKMVNDKFGHEEGDFALRTNASVLRESFRDIDIIGRLGGDEFVVFAITGIDCDVAGMNDRLERVMKRHNDSAGKPYPITMSSGIYKFTCSSQLSIYEVIDAADQLLYEEKSRKKKQFSSYR